MTAITPEARQRLESLQRFGDLGAGFALATADLEIRGTGDLLGAKQLLRTEDHDRPDFELPDAADYGDVGASTLSHNRLCRTSPRR